MQMRLGEPGEFPQAIAEPSPFIILYGNYWVFGQLIFVTLDLAAPVAMAHFEKIFASGLAVFGEVIGIRVPWADEVIKWGEEARASS